MPTLQPETVARLSEVIPPITYIKNPVDTARPDQEMFSKALAIVSKDPGIDVVATFAIHETAAVDPVVTHRYLKYKVDKPMIFGTAGFMDYLSPIISDLDALGVPAFVSPDRLAQAVWSLVEDAKISYRKTHQPLHPEIPPPAVPLCRMPDEAQAKALLQSMGIPVPTGKICQTRQEARTAFADLAKPCVVKIVNPEVKHKTEAGGVILNVDDDAALIAALDRIDAIKAPGSSAYLLEETAPTGLEIIIGGKNDISFGPTVLVGLGGTAAEAMGDVTMRLAPLTIEDALEMLSELKAQALFDRWRGGPQYDKDAVAEALVKIGELMIQHPEIHEMDINPVRVFEKGLMVLDALIVC